MTDLPDMERLAELYAAGTKGPWRAPDPSSASTYITGEDGSADVCEMPCWEPEYHAERDANAALIVAMHTALPSLLHAIREKDAEIAAMRERNRGLTRIINGNPPKSETLSYQADGYAAGWQAYGRAIRKQLAALSSFPERRDTQ